MSEIDRIAEKWSEWYWAAEGPTLEDAMRFALLEYGQIVREECATVAMDMPLVSNEERHAYRWDDTSKAVAWDIAAAIRNANKG